MECLLHITVILTCYREGILLREAVDSLMNQSYQNWDCAVVNDTSDDEETNAICTEISCLPKFKVIRNKRNVGLSGSRNVGIMDSQSDIFMCFDADDRLPSNSLLTIARAFVSDESLDFVYGDLREFGNNNKIYCPGPLSVEDILLSQKIDGHSAFRRKVWEKVGGFDMELSWGNQDWDFWLSVFEHGFRGKYVPEVLYEWRIRDGSMHNSYNKRWPEICEYMYKKHQKLYDKYSKKEQFLSMGWRQAAFSHYASGAFESAKRCAYESLSLVPGDSLLERVYKRSKWPNVVRFIRLLKKIKPTWNKKSIQFPFS